MTRTRPARLPPYLPSDSRRVRIAQRCWLSTEEAGEFEIVCAAAIESSAPFTVLAVFTAARLHRLWLPECSDVIHLASAQPGTAGRAMTRTRRPPFVAHRYQLAPDDITLVDGLPVTSLARTWRDLARYLDLPDLVAAGDSALRAGAKLHQLAALLDASPFAPRSRTARRALDLLDARSRSRPESHLRVAVSGLSIEPFGVNTAVYRAESGWLAEPDLSLPAAKLALEYQGSDHAEIARMRKDITRFADLRSENWLVLPYGPAEVFSRPSAIRAEVRREIWQRAPHLLLAPSRHHNRVS